MDAVQYYPNNLLLILIIDQKNFQLLDFAESSFVCLFVINYSSDFNEIQ